MATETIQNRNCLTAYLPMAHRANQETAVVLSALAGVVYLVAFEAIVIKKAIDGEVVNNWFIAGLGSQPAMTLLSPFVFSCLPSHPEPAQLNGLQKICRAVADYFPLQGDPWKKIGVGMALGILDFFVTTLYLRAKVNDDLLTQSEAVDIEWSIVGVGAFLLIAGFAWAHISEIRRESLRRSGELPLLEDALNV